MLVKIKRCKDSDSEPYWQTFNYVGAENVTVAAVLEELNYKDDLFDIDGNSAPRIRWECSCMQKICGGCAMVINNNPALACCTFLKDIKGDTLVLEPLSKFPVIGDLIVDRSIIDDNLVKAKAYLDAFSGSDKKEYQHQYSVGKCLKCGLCLEVCPNYNRGENFYGALFANDMYLLHSQSKGSKKDYEKEYDEHFAKGCSKSFACRDVCPMDIPTLSSMLKMNSKKY